MPLSRRAFLAAGPLALATGPASLSSLARETASLAPQPGAWRAFEVKTTLALPPSQGAQAWVPLPGFADENWIRPGTTTYVTASGRVERRRDPGSGAQMLHVVWPEGEQAPSIEVTSRFAARDRKVDPAALGAAPLAAAERQRYTAATALLPTDGIVRETALAITAGARDEIETARRLYEWVVDNTSRNAATRGCGEGNIAAMLRSGQLSGKCADINALFVGLARASGLPARDLYGIRVAPSAFGYTSLGASSGVITKAQHCRAEVFLSGAGWVPADPADVRKVVLEEPPGQLALADARVVAARAALFGAWEGNWLAYNAAHDVVLPGSQGGSIGFLMYPQAENAGARLDCLDADRFRYSISARPVEI